MLAVDRERLAREASEHHTSSLAETKRLVEEAEQRATAAEERAREADAAGHRGPQRRPDRGRGHPDPRPPRGRADHRGRHHPGRVDHRQRRLREASARWRPSRPRSTGWPSAATRSPPSSPRCATWSPASATTRTPEHPGSRRAAHRAGASRRPGDETEDEGAVGGPAYLGEPGPPLDHRAPFYLGFVGAAGALVAFWLLTNIAGDRLHADPDRGLAVPGRRAQPRGDVLRAARAAARLRRPRGDRRAWSSPSCCSSSPSCPVITDQVTLDHRPGAALVRPAAAQPDRSRTSTTSTTSSTRSATTSPAATSSAPCSAARSASAWPCSARCSTPSSSWC